MRKRFIQALIQAAETDDRVWLVCGDLGYSVLEPFASRFPDRFLNAGVAEQNMTGIAAGLALAGKIPFTYSIANFPVIRCLEQVRNDVSYHDLDVKIVAVGAGLSYGSAGYSHHAVEDVAIMRSMPNMVVFSPADPVETELVTRAAIAHRGPCYLRLGKSNEPVLHTVPPDFAIGRGLTLRSGKAGVILATGAAVGIALAAAVILADGGYPMTVISMPTLHPVDRHYLADLVGSAPVLVTLEEHGVGGLASIVAEALVVSSRRPRFLPIRLGRPSIVAGTQPFLQAQSGLSPESAAEAIRMLLHQGAA